MNKFIGKRLLSAAIFFVITNTVLADKLEDGFARLKIYDYFRAKEYFEKSLEKKTAGAAFGLSKIFYEENNPFFNLDSARKYILLSDSTFKTCKTKEKIYYNSIGVTDTFIQDMSNLICEKYFEFVQKTDSISMYEHYLETFSSCMDIERVVKLRNTAAFREASRINKASAYLRFSQFYPEAQDNPKAIELYQQRLFEEETVDNKITSFEKFMVDHPGSPYKEEADRMIYKLSTIHHLVQEYAAFARKYSFSKYAAEAWRQVYSLSMKDFTENTFNSFKANYPDYPFSSELETDFKLQNYIFLPIEKSEKWGYINEEGVELIALQYEEVSFFSEGLAAAKLNGKYGYINKSGKVVLPFIYTEADDFHKGYAIVMTDSFYGLINRKGEYLIKSEYEELSDIVEGFCIGMKNDKFGYISKAGKLLTDCTFDVANDFRDGCAVVAVNEKYGLINILGKFLIEPIYDDLIFCGKNLLKASNNNRWGIIDIHGKVVSDFIYDAIGEFSNGLALVAINGKYGYLNEAGLVKISLKYQYSSSLLSTGKALNGYILLRQKNKIQLADTSGSAVSFLGIEQYGFPNEGLIPIMKNKKWGFSDMNGEIKIQPKFEQVESFSGGVAIVKSKDLFGLINRTGAYVVQPLYDNVIPKNDYVVVVKDGKFGALTKNANLILPCAYRSVDEIGNKILRGTNDSRLIYVDLNGGIIYVGDRN